MDKLIVLVGPSGSGKSTYALELLASTSNAVIVSRDEMRRLNEPEDILSKRLICAATKLLWLGKTVIVDSINLHDHDRIRWETLALVFNVEFVWRIMATDLDTCIKRDGLRSDPVGEWRIRQQSAGL